LKTQPVISVVDKGTRMQNQNALFQGERVDRRGSVEDTRRKREPSASFWKLLFAVAISLLGGVISPASMAADAPATKSASAPIPQEKLDSLLAPIALYPDQLLTQSLMASTYPLDVVEAARFVKENKNLKGDALDKAVAAKSWDPSVQSLTAFPQVLEMMNDKLEWTQELGNAFLADEKRVMQTVQSLRQKADAAGNLKSNEQQKVVKEQSTIIIEPAQPEVVYVPSYNPTVVYGSWWAPMYPPYYWPPPAYYYPPGGMFVAGVIGFGIGMAIANNHWGWCNANWGGNNININVDRNNTFINNNPEFKNKVNNGNWQHNPSQRKGVAYSDSATRDKYRKADSNAVSSRRDARGFDSGSPRTSDRSGSGAGSGTRDVQKPSAGTRDMQRPDSGSRDFGSSNDRSHGAANDRSYGGGTDRSASTTRPSFDSGQSRQQTQSYSNRGASSRASMGGGGGRGGGGGGRR
jgi:hypothetical protein